ncbi:3-oxoacyl-[acyl-carrier-protein] reductase [bacterium Unc6]|nr:3-oxoacyl-[acyl-carrier-protein] reductase [bacterium Unc6]
MLNNKIAFITGAGRGIGFEIAKTLGKQGASLVLCDIDEKIITDSAKSLSDLTGKNVLGLVIDVTDQESVEEGVNKIIDKFQKIDILVNNAGITRDALILRMKDEDWDAVLNVNLKGAFHCIRSVSRYMLKQRSGKIINVASIIGLMGNPGQANYSASKAGLIGLTKTAAKEFASRGIQVNAVAPGFIETVMTSKLTEDIRNKILSVIPAGRFGKAEDIAEVVLFLSGSGSDYLTGEIIRIDGGMAM